MAFLTSAPPSITSYKTPAKVASTASLALSGVIGSIQIDSIALSSLSTGDRILLKNQGVDNGIYELTVSGLNYSLARSSDADTSAKLSPNSLVPVSQGTVNADNVFQLTNNSVNLGTDSLVFVAVDSVALAGLAAEVTNRTNANLLDLKIASNLSDLASVGTAKTNLSLQNVDNTSDANKPVSTAQQTALNLKADLISPVFTTPNIGSATGSILGNAATVTTNANLTGPVTSVGNTTAIANSAISNAMLANAAVANLSGTNTGDNAATSLVPSQASQANKVLATNGTTTSWQYAGLGSGSFGTDNLFLGAPPPGITSATGNTLIGATYPGRALTSGPGNTALGVNTLIYNTTGGANTAIGRNTLIKNVSGAYNVAIGDASLFENDTANFNIGIGYGALQENNGHNPDNVAIGGYALHVNVGMKNVALGHYAGRYATTASNEFYLDNQGRGNNTAEKTSGLMFGTFNSNPALQTLAINAAVTTPYTIAAAGAITGSNLSGTNTGDNAATSLVPSQTGNDNKVLVTDGSTSSWQYAGLGSGGFGTGNVFLGTPKPAGLSGAANSVYIGVNCGDSLTTATANTAIGNESLRYNLTGISNSALGRYSLQNTTGSYNTAIGGGALKTNTSGANNSALGFQALYNNVTGTGNIAIGYYAGRYATASDEFYLNNQNRTDTAGDKASSLMYGVFHSSAGSQTLAINAKVSMPYTLAVSGVATFTQAPILQSLNPSQILSSSATNQIVALQTATYPSLTELAYVKGVTSAVQTQLNSEATARAAAVLLAVPVQSGNTEKVLATNGSSTYWAIEGIKTGYPTGSTILGRLKPASISGTYNTLIGDSAGSGMTTASKTVAIGHLALSQNTTGFENNAIGAHALEANTTGYGNLAFGLYTLQFNISGYQNIGIGSFALNHTTGNANIAIGLAALYTNTSGSSNVAVGTNALRLNTTASDNVAVGFQALYNNTTGAENIAIGTEALVNNTTGGSNVAVGHKSLLINTTGLYNTAMGSYALASNTTAFYNTAVGRYALFANTTGIENTAIGAVSLQANTTGTANIAMGVYALEQNTTGGSNTAVGYGALKASTTSSYSVAMGRDALLSNTIGEGNVASGFQALKDNTSGAYNVASGFQALLNKTSGDNNVAIGTWALRDTTIAGGNVAIGRSALQSNTTASDNVAVGNSALYANTTGTENIGIGADALRSNITGVKNVFIGSGSGYSLTTGGSNNGMGWFALRSATTGSENTALGNYSLAYLTTGSNSVAVGSSALSGTTTGGNNVAVGWHALTTNVTGGANVALGFAAGRNSAGSYNTFIGDSVNCNWTIATSTGEANSVVGAWSFQNNTTGQDNSVLGCVSLNANTTGNYNVAIGREVLYVNTTGSESIAIGHYALQNNITGSNNVAIGSNAGRYATAGNEFYLNNQNRTDTAGDKAKSLMYGQFAADPANQTLVINATVSTPNSLKFTANADPGAQTDSITIGAKDATSTNRTMHLRTEEAVASNVAAASTHSLNVWINNVEYKIMLVAV